MSTLAVGLALTTVSTLVQAGIWGRSAVIAAAVFGLLATLIQVVAGRLVRQKMDAAAVEFGTRWVAGVALRFVGVALIAVAVMADRTLFPPLPTALGFLAVLIPLLFLEMRLAR